MNQGWICPKCQAVFAPFMMECKYCNKDKNIDQYIGNQRQTLPSCIHGVVGRCAKCIIDLNVDKFRETSITGEKIGY